MGRLDPFVRQDFLGGKSIFYVGGHYSGNDSAHYVCGQMFVEAYFPKVVTQSYPIIMFHGAGQTNVNWLITPDGRMGWADYFVSQGYIVYLAEQPARARSAYHPDADGRTVFHPIEILHDRFMSDQGSWPQAKKHTQWPGDGGEDETFRQFAASQVEYLPSNKTSQQLTIDAAEELLNRVGPAVLLTHSQAGPIGWLIADKYPELVKGVVAVEPFGPPFSNDLSSPVAKSFGIADLPLHYEPPVTDLSELELTLLSAPGDELKDGWVLREPARRLPNLQGKPILILTGEASYHAGYDHLTSYVLRQCGVEHDFVRLESVGIHGNGHMMMLEKNNLEIANYIEVWLCKHL